MTRSSLRLYVIAGEASGDVLGASFLDALRLRYDGEIELAGIGGEALEGEGLQSLFPMDELSLIGVTAILKQLPKLLFRLRETTRDVLRFAPDVLLVIDSPEFTHRIAQRVRRANPRIKIIKWVSPTVWAWRPQRAKQMTAYVDHLLAVFPFEPDVHRDLGGPPCSYVGHPLLTSLPDLTPGKKERPALSDGVRPRLVILPGSRTAEIRRLMPVFGKALPIVRREVPDVDPVIVAAPRRRALIEEMMSDWEIKPTIVTGEDAKFAAFRSAHVALAASGTVTLELALSGVPTVAAYRVDLLERLIARVLLRSWTILLPNFILGRVAVHEYLNELVRPEPLAFAVKTLAMNTPERRAQTKSFEELKTLMATPVAPAQRAVDIVLDHIQDIV